MDSFVTGATGFIGRHLLENLLARNGKIYVLVRSGSKGKLKALLDDLGGDAEKRIIPVTGDLAKARLGVSPKQISTLKGKIGNVFHLAAIYDIANEDAATQLTANVEGTRNAVTFAEAVNAKCFHHTSSIAAAGLFNGYWREDMFEEWEPNEHPYFRTKHDSEKVVREECTLPWRIYRPGIVVGHSKTGFIDKIDGPYFFFKMLQRLRNSVPRWLSLVGIEGGNMNIVPVDYVANAMDHIAHKTGLNGKTFHLTNPDAMRIGEVLNTFARAGHGPEFAMRIDAGLFNFIPKAVRDGVKNLPPVRTITDGVLADFGIPRATMKFINYPTKFDNRDAASALKGSGIACPPLESYAAVLWDYWERNLDPALFQDRTLSGAVKGKVVIVTGATSGIGLAVAEKLVASGAITVIAARTAETLAETKIHLKKKGKGEVHTYTLDAAEIEDCDKFVKRVIDDLGRADILVNNAGRSIRRSVSLSYDRFHDFERTMQLNYFGALRLIMGFLPHMVEQNGGQIINVLSIGVQANQPRFSAYVASKAALGAFSSCAQPEFQHNNIYFTNVYMPLVRTPMIAPTKMYDHVPTLAPEEAANLICRAIVEKPTSVSTRLGTFAQVLWALAPKAMNTIFNTTYRLFPDSDAARGAKKDGAQPQQKVSNEAVALAMLTRGIHW
ncbi:SDR family oxidoreductase [Pyruvatibacter sp.]|uniref:SDR family oxidoreductase n=1 Tax=Pyruvatibacter sp. TaxID=1981328 RepID=UPI0032EB12DA